MKRINRKWIWWSYYGLINVRVVYLFKENNKERKFIACINWLVDVLTCHSFQERVRSDFPGKKPRRRFPVKVYLHKDMLLFKYYIILLTRQPINTDVDIDYWLRLKFWNIRFLLHRFTTRLSFFFYVTSEIQTLSWDAVIGH